MARSAQDPRLPVDLLPRLRRGPSTELKQLVQDHGRFFGLREVRELLLNPFVDGETLQELAAVRRLLSMRPVQAAVARHSRTPEPVAMRLVPHLFWRELLEVTVDVRIRSSVRRVAERYLIERLPSLAVGEQIALARRSTVAVSRKLVRFRDVRVLEALLENPRMTEETLMALLTWRDASSRSLALVADHERWGRRYEVALALCRHPQTPFRVILERLPRLARGDLEVVAAVDEHSGVILRRVEELLERRSAVKFPESPIEVEPVPRASTTMPLDTQDSDTLE